MFVYVLQNGPKPNYVCSIMAKIVMDSMDDTGQ